MSPTIAIVGATGAVGGVALELLSNRSNIWGEIRLIASARSAGRKLVVRGQEVEVQALSEEAFDGVDVALFSVGDDISAEWAPRIAAKGVVVIDKSNAFRMDPDVPLVVPEINPEHARHRPKGIIANANCTTLASIMAIAPLHREYGLKELVLASYQAAGGAGASGMEALFDQAAKVAGDRQLGTRTGNVRHAIGDDLGPFPAPLAFNVIPWAGSLKDGGWSSEELKMRNETRKILGLPNLKVSATCVRVPVLIGHSIAVHAVFGSEVDAEVAREVLNSAPGVIVVDDPASGEFPMPIDAVGTDPSWVGRIRRSVDDPRALDFFVTGDNLRKGAALNGIQIAELIYDELKR